MIGALLIGLGVGFFMSIPPGPIAVAVMRQAIEGNDRQGMKIGLGAATMDTIYSLIAIFASSALIVSLKSALTLNGWILVAFQLACIATLIVLGIRYLKATNTEVAKTAQKEQEQEERARKMGRGSSAYFIGIVMSITNLASPTFIPLLVAVASYVHAKNLVDSSIGESALYAVGFGSGAALWFVLLLRTIYKWRKRLSSSFISRLYTFAGWSFMVFAAILVFHIVVGTNWSELFH